MEKSRTLALEVTSVIKELEDINQAFAMRQTSTIDVAGSIDDLVKSAKVRLIKNLAASIERDTRKNPNNISAIR